MLVGTLLMRMSEEDFDNVMDVNLKSVFNMTKAIQKTMLKNRNGVIINMSSVVGVKGNAGQTNYAASKAGVIGFSKSVALDLYDLALTPKAVNSFSNERAASSDELYVNATFAPCFANVKAIPLPIPRVAPVIIAVFPSNSFM